MLHPLQQRVRSVGQKARRWLLLHAIAMLIAVALIATLMAGLIDYTFRISDMGIRVILSLSVIAAIVVVTWRYILPAFNFRRSDVSLAKHIEGRHAELGDRLSSTMEFLGQDADDPTAGSVDLRRAVVAETMSQVEGTDLSDCLDGSRSKKMTLVAAGVCAIALIVGACNVNAAGLALKRMLLPWGDDDWPRRHSLAFDDAPTKLAAGQDLVLAIVDQNGQLPDDVVVEYQDERGEIQAESPMILADDRAESRLTNVTRSLHYRVRGGDDQTMEWRALDVVEAPQIKSLQAIVRPPSYTRLPDEELTTASRVLVGSRISIVGTVTKPVAEIRLRCETQEEPLSVSFVIADDGRSFQLPARTSLDDDKTRASSWVVDESDTFWLELVDREGLIGRSEVRFEIRAVKDLPPTVAVEKPAGAKFLTAEAVVPISALVKDDLAVHVVEIVHSRSDQSDVGEQTRELYRGEHLAPQPKEVFASLPGESREVAFDWDLSQLTGTLTAGTHIDFHLRAQDYRPNIGNGTTRRITIISAEELEDRVAARQASILGQLAEVLRMQRAAKTQSASLTAQVDETKRIESRDIDQLQSTELNQRSVTRMLTSGSDSVATKIRDILEDLKTNRVDRPEVTRKLKDILDIVNGIAREQIPRIQSELIDALKVARAIESPDDSTSIKTIIGSLHVAGDGQDEVIVILESLLGDLTQWDNYRRFAREVSRIRSEQEALQSETNRQRIAMLSAKTKTEEAQQRANLRQLAFKQMELTRRFDRLQSRMDKMKDELAESDPLASATMNDAIEAARRSAVSTLMRESGRKVESGQAGQASSQQKKAIEGLREVQDVLSNRRENELGRLTEKLKDAQGDAKKLHDQQVALTRKLEANAKNDGLLPKEKQRELMRLAKEQKKLADQAEELGRRLQRLQAENPSTAMNDAASAMQQASQAGEEGDETSAEQKARESERLLKEAQEQLQNEVKKREQDLLNEQLVRLEQTVKSFIKRQQTVNDRTSDFAELLESQGELKRSQRVGVGDLAAEQRLITDEIEVLAQKIAEADTFTFALRAAMREMARSASGLERRDVGDDTMQAQENALARLTQLHEALQPEMKDGPEQPQTEGGRGGAGGQPPPDGIQRLAELKLVKLLQEEVNRRTMELAAEREQAGALSDTQIDELTDLSQQQGELAEMILSLIQEAASQPEDDPDSLPDLRDDVEPNEELMKELDTLEIE